MLFLGLPKGEKLLKTFFTDPLSKFWWHFVLEQAELFAESVLKIEGDEVAAIEVVQYLDELVTLKTRKADNCLSHQTTTEKQKLIDDGYSEEVIKNTIQAFFDDACEYIDLWAGPIMELKIYSWAMLRKEPEWKDVESVMNKLNISKIYSVNENSAKVHKEFGYVKNYCSEAKIKQWKKENVSISKRWVEIFNHLDAEYCDYKEMAAIVEYILCLPGSTASVERVFASMNKTWTDEKSQLKNETLKAILTTKINLKMSCIDFYHWIKTKPDMLRNIKSKDKYCVQAQAGGTERMEDESDNDIIDEDSGLI